jgi:hypothetical protein
LNYFFPISIAIAIWIWIGRTNVELLRSIAPRAASRGRAVQINFDFVGSQESEDKKLAEYIIFLF